MYFRDLRGALVQNLQARVRNGQITERRLARLIGASQPHIHNVLKGTRFLSLELSDRILEHLGTTVLDLIGPATVLANAPAGTLIRVLEGLVGPGHPWPEHLGPARRFPISSAEVGRMSHPVAARLAADGQMAKIFREGEWVILNQAPEARLQLDPDAYYLVQVGGEALIRRIRLLANSLYVVPEEAAFNPAQWRRVPAAPHELLHVIRARVRFMPPDPDTWFTTGTGVPR